MMKQTLTVAAAVFLFACSPDMKPYESLVTPALSTKAPQKMLVLEAVGDPNQNMKMVGDLYKTYFKLKFKGKKMTAPRARWTKSFDTPRAEWVAYWALPVADEVTSLPAGTPSHLRLETWDYGTVAEILHKGPYSEELPAVGRLHDFISNQGYVISQPHEEEYLKGPGMAFVKPAQYYTIIRYVVVKK